MATAPGHGTPGAPDALPPGNLSVARKDQGKVVVLAVAGELDIATTPKLEAALTEAAEDRPEGLVVDLSGVAFLGSVGITALVAAHERASGAASGFALVADGHSALRALRVTGVAERIGVHATLSEALDALRPG